ncbi:Zinc finger protein with KRAB and SCAN domains 3 [Folsomia candida]|uniref:Zinc finger protein with KRAB and SCAN domains 3 n=1 Tax=Folsomia candida TaxID=158441 RepID=A0A226DLZ0_FOLCA|nr:Zinc finger protein with KRAB and SCAN domains 3 [Folsomia candida]
MEPGHANELSAEIEFLKQSISRSEQRIRQIVNRAGVILDQDEFDDNPTNVTRLLNLLDEILSLNFTDFVTLSTSEPLSQTNLVLSTATDIEDVDVNLCDPSPIGDGDVDIIYDEIEVKDEFISEPLSQTNLVLSPATYIEDGGAVSDPLSETNLCDPAPSPHDNGDVDLIDDEVEVKDKFSSQEYQLVAATTEKDVAITEQPDELEPADNQDHNLDFEFVAPHVAVAPRQRRTTLRRKPTNRKDVLLPSIRSKLRPGRSNIKTTYLTGSKNTNAVSRSRNVTKTAAGKRDVMDSPSKIDFVTKKLHVEPSPSDASNLDDDHDDEEPYLNDAFDCDDDDYIPTSISSSDEEHTLDAEFAPSRRQKPVSKKRKRPINKNPTEIPSTTGSTKLVLKKRKQCKLIHAQKVGIFFTNFSPYLPAVKDKNPSQVSSTTHPTGFVPIIDPATGTQKFHCLDCSKIIGSGGLLYHRRIHTGEKPYPCPTCGIAFRAPNTLSSHCRRHHPTEKTEYFCDQCPKSFRIKEDVLIHQKFWHPKAGAVMLLCSKCPKQFHVKGLLDRHMRMVHIQVFDLHSFGASAERKEWDRFWRGA